MAKTPEGLVKDKVKAWCKKYDLWHIMIMPSPYGATTGVSDFQILHKGTLVAIETKAKTNTKGPTDKQQQYLDNVIKHGGKAYVVRNDEDLAAIALELGLTCE